MKESIDGILIQTRMRQDTAGKSHRYFEVLVNVDGKWHLILQDPTTHEGEIGSHITWNGILASPIVHEDKL